MKKDRKEVPVPARSGGKWIWAAVLLFLSVFSVRELIYISGISQTYDEHFYISYGYSFLKTGEFRLRKDKTNLVPIASALPLLATKADFSEKDPEWLKSDTSVLPEGIYWALSEDLSHVWKFSLDFLYRNKIPADSILFYARLPIIIFSLFLGFFVFKWTRELYGDIPALASLFLYTNCPNILAHSGLVTEDLTLGLMSFLTIYFFYRYHGSRFFKDLIFSGIFLGLALNAKYTALVLFPVLGGLSLFEYLRVKDRKIAPFIRETGIMLAAAALVLLVFYRFYDIKQYFIGFKFASECLKAGQAAFLRGEYSSSGFWNYFVYAFLLKTPVPLLISLAAYIGIKIFSWKKVSDCRDEAYLLALPVVLFAVASASNLQIGLRYILPVYPFLFVLSGKVVSVFRDRLKFPLLALGAWYLISSFSIHPHYLAYFNEAAGGPSKGYEYLLDSNLDWGQDLKGLKKYVKENGVSDVVLSYFGTSVPEYVGFEFQDLFSFGIWGDKKHVNSAKPSREILAISVTNLQGLYLSKIGTNTFFWLKDKRPAETIGHSIFVYDITEDAEAHEYLAHIYLISGEREKGIRESRRALAINPGSGIASFLLALLKLDAKDLSSVKAACRFLEKEENLGQVMSSLEKFIKNQHARKVYSNAFLQLGLMSLNNNLPEKGERALRISLGIDGTNLYAQMNLGALYIRKKEYAAALEALSKAEKLDPSVFEVVYNKGVAFYYLGDYADAGVYLKKAFEIKPSPEIKNLLEQVLRGAAAAR